MNALDALKAGWRILRFDEHSLESVRDDENTTRIWVTLTCALAVLWAILFALMARPFLHYLAIQEPPVDLSDQVLGAAPFVGALLGLIIGFCTPVALGIYHLSAKILGSQAQLRQHLAVFLSANAVLTLLSAPLYILLVWSLRTPVGMLLLQPFASLLSIYSVVLTVWLLRGIHRFTLGRAIATYAIPVLFFFILTLIAGFVIIALLVANTAA
jgi:hypothetical protein